MNEKKEFGQLINGVKSLAEVSFQEKERPFADTNKQSARQIDLSLPAVNRNQGAMHPITRSTGRNSSYS